MSRRSKNRNKNVQGTKEKVLLNSAVIREGRDSEILQEDLIREFQPDRYNSDQSLLVNNEWVRFFNKDSSFLKGLMALVQNSTTLRNVLNQKTTLTLGEGFIPMENSDSVPILQTVKRLLKKLVATDDSIQQLNDLLSNVNLNNETFEEVLEKAVFDWWSFGNAMVELVKTERNGQPVVLIYHIPLHKTAIKKTDDTNIIKYVGISDNWEFDSGSNATIKKLPIYPTFEADANGVERSVIHIKNYAPGFFYWGLPSWMPSRFWCEIEYRIPKYNISKFKNGFVPSAVMQFFGSLTQDEAKKLVNSVEHAFTDTGKNAKMLVQVLSDEKYKMNLEVLEDKSDGNYMDLQKIGSQAIVTSNGWTMSLAGFATGGKLGTNQQIRDELDFVMNVTIKPSRRKFLQSIVNPFIKENQAVGAAPDNIMLNIANMNPISLASMLDPKQVLLMNEQREILGFDALEEGEMNTDNTNEQQPQSE